MVTSLAVIEPNNHDTHDSFEAFSHIVSVHLLAVQNQKTKDYRCVTDFRMHLAACRPKCLLLKYINRLTECRHWRFIGVDGDTNSR